MSATVHHAHATPSAIAVPVARRVSWGAIIAGALLTLVVQIMLGLLGIGIGLSTVDPAGNGTPTASTLGTSAGLWATAVVLVATFVGGYVAARLAASATKTDGALHGIVTWAVSTLLIIYLLTSGAASLISGTLGVFGSSLTSIKNVVQSVNPDSLSVLPAGLQNDARQLLARGQQQVQQTADQAQAQGQQAADQARAATGEQDLTRAIPEILRGLGDNATPEQRQAAVTVISQQAGISQQEAEQRLQQFQTRYDQAKAELRQQADAAAKGASTAALAGFGALLAGLIVAAIGGAMGRPRRVDTVINA